MITFAVTRFRRARSRARLVWAWAVRHPRLAALLFLVGCWLLSAILAVPAAYADGAASSSAPPYMPPSDLKDSNGVPLWRYTMLPLDRGDVWHPSKTWISGGIDLIWTINLASFSWCLWLLSFLLQFTWVDWIATPVGAIADIFQSLLSQLGWPVVAMMVAGLVFGMALAFGKFGRGAADLTVSVLCFVLATGALANPVTALTGEHGALTWAEATGANLSVSVLSTDGAAPTGTPDKDDAQQLISQSLMGGLIDVFVRIPSQEIAFGHTLSGQCDTTFTQQMKNASAFDSSSTTVRDAVGKCDKAAQDYVTHPSFGQVMTALSVMGGSGTLFTIALAMALVTLIAVIYALLNALKLMGNVYAAMLPGVAREGLWRSFIGMYVGALSVGVSVVMLAGYLKILASVMKAVSDAGLTIVAQTTIIDIFVIALVITLFLMFFSMRRRGKKMADWLAKFGYGRGGSKPVVGPLMKTALDTASRYGANGLSKGKPPTPAPLPATSTAAPQPPTAPLNAGHFTASKENKQGRLGAAAQKAIGVASTAGQIAAAASTGGASAVTMKTAQIGGKKVMQRQAVRALPASTANVLGRKTSRGGLPARGGMPMPQAQPFGRQIVVDKTGVGRIAPATQARNGTYSITRLQPRPVSTIRAALEQAAKKGTSS